MKALVSVKAGGPSELVLMDVPVPSLSKGQLLINVQAVGVNFPDGLFIRDQYQLKLPRPFSPGAEFCGVVEAVADDVTTIAIGERVIGRSGWGAMAQKIAIGADRCLPIPRDAAADEAAALQFTYATAYHALHDAANIQPGETLLVLGAAGGVGTAAVDLGRAAGARVLSAVSTPDKLAFTLSRGAANGIVYPATPAGQESQRSLTEQIKRMAGPAGVDVVFDPLGGGYSEAATRSLSRYGRHLVIGFTAGIAQLPLNLVLLKTTRVIGVDWRSFSQLEPAANDRNVRELIAMWQAGRIRPYISERYPLEQGAQAIARLEARAVMGKVVVTVS